MKKRIQGFVAGVIATLLITGIYAVAKNMYEKIDVLYNDITIKIDGEEFVPTDVNGNIVEPFIYNGTTFLPVRAIATAFDKDVAWDGDNFIVSINGKAETKPDAAEEENTPTEDIEYGSNLTDENLIGFWQTDISAVLVDLDVPEDFKTDYSIILKCHFGEDGKYTAQLPESSVDNLVDASFEYALRAYGVTEEHYPQMTGISVEQTKDQIKSQLDISDFSEEGTYYVENGVLYMTVDGYEQEAVNYIFEDGVLTLFDEDTKLVLTREQQD